MYNITTLVILLVKILQIQKMHIKLCCVQLVSYLRSTMCKLREKIPKVFKEIFLVCIETVCFEFKYWTLNPMGMATITT